MAELDLKAVTLGRGIQNYTCANSDAATKPVAIGAVADLFDLKLLPQFMLKTFTECALNIDQAVTSALRLPTIGKHYFDAAGTPVFDLGSVGLLNCKKLAGVPAPSDAVAGPFNGAQTGAVDWLYLGDKGGSNGVKEVYRVETAGGKPPATCDGQAATIQMPYSTQYWFYG